MALASCGAASFCSFCHFLQEVPKHGGVIISAIWGPAGSYHSPCPWSQLRLGSVAGDMQCLLVPLFSPLNTSLLLVDHALSQQSESCEPSSQGKHTPAHFCVQWQGVEHVLIKVHEAQVKDPSHTPYPPCFETWRFMFTARVVDCMRRASLLFCRSCGSIHHLLLDPRGTALG